MNDVTAELYAEFPELEPKAIDKICKDGIVGLLKLLRKDEEMLIFASNDEAMKFYLPRSPKNQEKLTIRNINRRKRAAERKQNGETSK